MSFLCALAASAQPDYSSAHWVPPTCTKYYGSGNGHKFCVIHDMEGYYLTSISYLNRCDTDTNGVLNVQASVNYLVNGLRNGVDEDGNTESLPNDAAPGDITQSVRDANYAWHARCWNTWMYGTEHEGFVTSPIWYTEAMYQASAALQRYLCNKSSIPKDRNHIIGHNEWQNSAWTNWMAANFPAIDTTCNTHTDPGMYWDWTHFIALINSAPGIIRHPWSRVVEPGSNVTFTVLCTNVAGATYQWRKNGNNIAGATTSAFPINNVQSGDAGSYSVVLTNGSGAITSRVAILTVSPPWTVSFSDDFETNSSPLWNLYWGAGNGISDFTTNWAFDYSTTRYVANGVTNFIPAAPNSAGTHGLKITVNKNDATAATAGVSLYPKSLSFTGSYALRFDMWINYNGGSGGGSGSTEYATFGLNHTGTRANWSGATSSDGIWFAVDGDGGSGGSDYRAYVGSAGAPTLLSFTSSGLGANGAVSANASDPFWQDVLPMPTYETPGVPGKRWVQCELSQIGNVITWQINGVVFAQRTNTSGYTSGNVMIGYMDPFSSIANPAADNFGIIDNVRVLIPATAPTITGPPQSLITTQNLSASFNVSASGASPLGYQWRFNGGNISGAIATSYTIGSVQSSNAGTYTVVVTNIAGAATSSPALLTVLVPPSITTQPQSQSVKAGTNAIFSVLAAGTAPLRYQWLFGSSNIPGATASAYTRSSVQSTDAGNYSVLVTNATGLVLSSNAILMVIPLAPLKFDAIGLNTGQQIKLVLSGEPGTYSIASSSNLVDWVAITNVTITNGPVESRDAFNPALGSRFYRATTQ